MTLKARYARVGTIGPLVRGRNTGSGFASRRDGVPDLVLKADLPRNRQRGQAPSRCACWSQTPCRRPTGDGQPYLDACKVGISVPAGPRPIRTVSPT